MVREFIESLVPFEVRDAANFGCYWLVDGQRLLDLGNPDDARVLADIRTAGREAEKSRRQRTGFVDI
jgi:hypothetical protein